MTKLVVEVLDASDLMPKDGNGSASPFVEVDFDQQRHRTQTKHKDINPSWSEKFVFNVSDPKDLSNTTVDVVVYNDQKGNHHKNFLGRVRISGISIPLSESEAAVQRYPLEKRGIFSNIRGDIALRVYVIHDPSYSTPMQFDGAGVAEPPNLLILPPRDMTIRWSFLAGSTLRSIPHVLDEATHYSSDLQPSSKHLQKQSIGILELGILSARNLLPMKTKNGRTTDAYCVAKYGNKWIRTRTILDTLAPRWNEQYTWQVYDPCTVVTIGVFDNCHLSGNKEEQSKDQRIGKVRIRLSTLETDRVYIHYYPLLVLQPGLKKTGELQLALRFTCTGWVNMVNLYSKPLLPKMHYVHPIPVHHLEWLRHQAMLLVAARLARAEPPLRREAVEYMLDVDYHMWSLRRSKANFNRIMSLLSGIMGISRWLDEICNWRNPMTTCLVHVLFVILVCYPELILPTVFLYLFVIGIWNYRFRPRQPPYMDSRLSYAERAHPDELDEEFDTFPTSRPPDIVRMRYDRLRSVAGRVQTVAGDLATQGERIQAILSWRDPRATAIFIIFSLIWAIILYVTPFQVVAVLLGLYALRHPRFRSKMPSVPFNFFKRLPAKSDMLL